MLIFIGENEKIKKVRKPLVYSLIRSAENDPYSEALFGHEEISHKDGWGRLNIAVNKEGKFKIEMNKSVIPIYNDYSKLFKNIDDQDSLKIEIIHARAASLGTPVNIFSTHPVESITKLGYQVYVNHNGSVEKRKLLRILGINENTTYAKLHNDTYFLTKYIASKISEEINQELIKDIVKFTKTALNISITLIKEKEVQIMVGSFYKLINKPKERKNYYKMYASINENLKIYASSTLIDFYKPKINLEWKEIPNGHFDVYSIKYDKQIELSLISSFNINETT